MSFFKDIFQKQDGCLVWSFLDWKQKAFWKQSKPSLIDWKILQECLGWSTWWPSKIQETSFWEECIVVMPRDNLLVGSLSLLLDGPGSLGDELFGALVPLAPAPQDLVQKKHKMKYEWINSRKDQVILVVFQLTRGISPRPIMDTTSRTAQILPLTTTLYKYLIKQKEAPDNIWRSTSIKLDPFMTSHLYMMMAVMKAGQCFTIFIWSFGNLEQITTFWTQRMASKWYLTSTWPLGPFGHLRTNMTAGQ